MRVDVQCTYQGQTYPTYTGFAPQQAGVLRGVTCRAWSLRTLTRAAKAKWNRHARKEPCNC
jgi:hypothetical protein